MMDLPGREKTIHWGGALRWLKSTAEDNQIHRIALTLAVMRPALVPEMVALPRLSAPLFRYHQQLKQQLDPCGVFNPGRMYAEL